VSFPLNTYICAALSSFIVTLVSSFFWRKWCLRVGLMDEPGHRKIHAEPIPLAGGLAVLTGLMVPTIGAVLILMLLAGNGNIDVSWLNVKDWLGPNATALLQYGLSRRAIQLSGVFLGAIGILAVGWLDDRHELRPRSKFLGQLLIAILVAASGIRVTLFIPNPWLHYALTILWILTLINAFNFIDNMNGLCGGLAAIAALYFGLIAAGDGQYLVGLIAFLTFGALLAFLPGNFPRARMFLGDAGSHLLGYLMAVLAILPHFHTSRQPRPWAVLIPLLVLAVPLADLVWVVILRQSMGKPFYVGDNNHISHRLVRAGLTPVRAVLLLWLAAALIGGLAFLIL
jgi:UDP-GlcNAc:undecaprenyl-phosphate/decaprenyl-phosphate GlcNAc-1-phosphate transferase